MPVQHVKIKKNMGFGLIMASLFFFFNPDISVIDILPDFIGYILMVSGLSQLAMLNSELESAYNGFKRMIIVSIFKPVSVVLLYGVFASGEQASGNLMFAFTFAVLDLIFLIPAYVALFDGLIYVSGRRRAKAVFVDKRGKAVGDRAKRFTIVFVIAKAACALLPETLALTTTEYTDNITMYLYNFIGHFRTIFFIISLVFGIIWLSKTSGLFKAVKNEREFIDSLKESFETELSEREGVFIERNIHRGILVLIAGALLCVDLHIPDFNILPDVLAAAFIAIGAFMLRKYLKCSRNAVIASGVYFAVSAIASLIRIHYLEEFGFFSAANYKEAAFNMFYGMVVSTLVENIVFVVVAIFALMMLKDAVDRYSGSEIINEANRESGRITYAQRSLYVKLNVTGALAVVAAVCSVLYDLLLIERGFFTDIMWALDFAVSAVFAAFFVFTSLAIVDEIKSKYMYS